VLSLESADVVQEYRRGAETEQRRRDNQTVDTEDLRQAIQHTVLCSLGSSGSSDTDEVAGRTTKQAAAPRSGIGFGR
jgi:hypothetical protein